MMSHNALASCGVTTYTAGSLDLVKQTLAQAQLRLRGWNCSHPKLQAMVRCVLTWLSGTRLHRREKVSMHTKKLIFIA